MENVNDWDRLDTHVYALQIVMVTIVKHVKLHDIKNLEVLYFLNIINKGCDGGIWRMPSGCSSKNCWFSVAWLFDSTTKTLKVTIDSAYTNGTLQWSGVGFNSKRSLVIKR